MKKFLMSFLLLLPLSAIAQEDYLSLLSGDRVWTMKYDIVSYPVGAVRFSETILRGDTVINGIKYMRVNKTSFPGIYIQAGRKRVVK